MGDDEPSEELRAILEQLQIEPLPARGAFEVMLAHAFGSPPAVRSRKTVAGHRLIDAIDDVADRVTDQQFVELMDAAKELYHSM